MLNTGKSESYNYIKGLLVEFYRESTKGDYLEAINKFTDILNDILKENTYNSVQYGRWLLKNAIAEDRGAGLCYWFENKPYDNSEMYVLWYEKFRVKPESLFEKCVHPYDDVIQDENGYKCNKCGEQLTD